MGNALEIFFDSAAEQQVSQLWQRLEAAGVPSLATKSHRKHRPHVTLAFATSIPARARQELRADLRLLALPRLWLHHISAFTGKKAVLMLGVMVDAELLAVHSAVHDVLAGKAKSPAANCLPGSWVPHCTLASSLTEDELMRGFAAVQPFSPIQAQISEIGIVDSTTGEIDTVYKW